MVGSIRSYSKISDGTQESFIYTVLRRPYISVKIIIPQFHLPAGKGYAGSFASSVGEGGESSVGEEERGRWRGRRKVFEFGG